WCVLAMFLRELRLLGLESREKGFECAWFLQRTQASRVGGRDVHRDVARVNVHCLQTGPVVIDRARIRRVEVPPDVESQNVAVLRPEARALHVGDEALDAFVIEPK